MASTGLKPERMGVLTRKTTYLNIRAIERLIKNYEEQTIADNLFSLVCSLLTFAFDPKDNWVSEYRRDEKKNHLNVFLVKIDKNGNEGNEDSGFLHTMVKVIFNSKDPFPEELNCAMARLDQAPMSGNRCWGILIRGLELRLIEYHRDQRPGLREIPCDFVIDGKVTETVHIRNNPREVHNILTRLPGQWPQPLSDSERRSLMDRRGAPRFESSRDWRNQRARQ